MAASPPALRLLPALIAGACALAPAGPALADTPAETAPTATSPGTVVVTGQRLDQPGSVTVLDADAISRQGANDMQNMARYSPLVSVPGAASGSGNVWDGAGNTGFNVRGVEGNRVSLDLDGIELPDAAPKPDASTTNSFGVGRDYFDPETFRSVTIASGTSAAGPGAQGLGGAVSFVTKSADDYVSAQRPGYAEYKFGIDRSTGMRMHAVTGAAQHGVLRALAVLVHRDGRELESAGAVRVNPDDWDSDALLAKLAWSPWAGHDFTATLDGFRARHDRAYDNKQGASYPDGAKQASRTRRDRASIDHVYTGNAPWFSRLESRLYVQDAEIADVTNARYVTGGQQTLRDIATSYKTRSVGVASNAVATIGVHSLDYGFSVENTETSRPWREDRTVVATGAHQVTVKHRMADMDSLKLAAFARGTVRLSNTFSAIPGLRYTWREMKPDSTAGYAVSIPNAARELGKETDSYATPSLTLNAQLTRDMLAYAQYSRGTRLPTSAERTGTYDSFSYTGAGNGYAVIGNPDLEKETSNAFEIGLKGYAARGLKLHAAVFQTRYKNFIEYAAQPADPVNYPTITFGLYRPDNVGDARTWGGEASLEAELGAWNAALRGARLTLASGVQKSKARNILTDQEGPLASTLPRKSSFIASWDDTAGRGGVSFAAVYVAAKQANPDVISGVTTARFAVPSSTVLDLTAYWNINRHASLTAGIYNLADRKYWDYASSRGLPAGTTAAALADIERQARPGRYAAMSLKISY
ncbi:TonB-dependent receptor [Massilia sp. G4R7]|uniref:TonB-dependent receptor n=1 Tax=Massilia phyllostachyos TaxID=2898585 RepID=A0ABS8QA76_9BURK|nr:TonB-dependent receptor [Massilia phyllostachyos]MCD2518652.1 TonB-dependent receptor [Massilia phyllostachyos]